MTYLNYPESVLLEKGALCTAREMAEQPALWRQTAEKFFMESEFIRLFLQKAYPGANSIILTGAGTSAFIGLSLQGSFFRQTNKITRAIATTDIVSHPQHYFNEGQAPLIISFARSGNSPESCAALELADRLCKKCFHLIITCNKEGELAKYQSPNPVYAFVLPPESNDKSLAMTSSYSCMLLSGLLLAYIGQREFCQAQIRLITAAAEKILSEDIKIIRQIAELNFQRAVFLGSGPLFGTATEAALKLQELTDGQVICKAESYLGFRHGPKAVIDETTLIVYFFSNNSYVRQYEQDLLRAMKIGNSALFQLGVSERGIVAKELQAQIVMDVDGLLMNGGPGDGRRYRDEVRTAKRGGEADGEGKTIAEDFLTVCSIIPGQLLGFYKSLQSGLSPDSPSISGAISRVVEGVNIYPEPGFLNIKK